MCPDYPFSGLIPWPEDVALREAPAQSESVMEFVLTIALTLAGQDLAKPAATKVVPMSQLAVDVVALKTGRSLRGAIVQRQPGGATTIAVSRTWLQTANPELYEQHAAADRESQRTAWQQTRDRTAAWLDTLAELPRLEFFLKQELARLDKLLVADEPDLPPFLLIDLPASSIARVTPAAAERQRLALLAWNDGWTDVETRDVASLRAALTKQKIKLDGPPIDLSDRLPARSQDDREWATRQAAIEYTFRQPIDFQGTGDTLVRTGTDQKPDLAAIIPKLLQQQVGALVQDLLSDGRRPVAAVNDRDWLAPAITATMAANGNGFRVTRVLVDPATNRTTVECRFVARVAEQDWRTIWQTAEVADGSVPRPELEARIEQDPQVKSALASLKSLGLVDDAPLRQAIRMGAATMSAQQAADGQFFAFTDRYAKRIDAPRIVVPAK
jgi:hypothetical protein